MEEKETKKSLKYSLYDGAAFAVMDGMTSSFITPFAVALNASVGMIAALTYVPQLVGASKTEGNLFRIMPKKPAPKKENEAYNKKLVKLIEKNISPKKEKHELKNIHDIEHITEEIEKGKIRK